MDYLVLSGFDDETSESSEDQEDDRSLGFLLPMALRASKEVQVPTGVKLSSNAVKLVQDAQREEQNALAEVIDDIRQSSR